MLNNLTNFYNLIRGRMLRTSTTVAPTDIIPLGVVNPNYGGGYAPSAITVEDLAIAIQPDTPTLQQVSDTGGLDDGSNIQQGNVERFGLTGISRVCSQGFEIQFVNGVEYYLTGGGGQIWQAISSNGLIPDNTYDEVQGFQKDSIYNDLKTRISYICTDATTDNAVWLPMGGDSFPTVSEPNGAVSAVSLAKAFYSISNGIVDVSIQGNIDVDFSSADGGSFLFTFPTDVAITGFGNLSFDTSKNCNGFIIDNNVTIISNDTTLVTNIKFFAKFTYQAY